ncbi:23S rRNA (uracil(1939)-C(5))-methyltransferase RlmD [Kovacikia minuta]|uniref:23S rRNA (uracil(1939)-C(5))-methyltransferase RlmD n=1 Tax=Kovacikia minuta TaxID=2931930 RepID=UPI0036F21781
MDYAYQLEAKQNIVAQALERIGGFTGVTVAPILAASNFLGYRNKATYPLARASARSAAETGQVQAGYYQKGSHQIVNLNQCPVQDVRLNPLLAEVKQDIQKRGWGIYDEKLHRGKLRHLGLRIGRRTGEMLLTLVVKDSNLVGIEEQAQEWLNRYPNLVGVSVNINPDRTNAILGSETHTIAGRAYLQEEFAGLTFQIRPDTFFQVHTEQAEALLQVILEELKLQGSEILVDAYCGIGTLTLPLAQRVRQAIAVDVQPAAVEQAKLNARLNHLENVTFQTGAVETVLPVLSVQPDIILVDPPRKGCDRSVLETLLQIHPEQIVYVSCNPATLARDLKILCADSTYSLTQVQPADFFPQTSHVECAAFLVRSPGFVSKPGAKESESEDAEIG